MEYSERTGVDGEPSLSRIAAMVVQMSDPDVVCSQEISVNTLLPDGSGDDQVAQLSALFPDYTAIFGPAVDRLSRDSKGRALFGNVILSRLPVLCVFHHPLPQSTAQDLKQMPRQMVEVTVDLPTGPLRIMTTHLEFRSVDQRAAQTDHIIACNSQIVALANMPPKHDPQGPYSQLVRAADCVICGDFNFALTSPEYQRLVDAGFQDCWSLCHPQEAHAPTCGIHDHRQWPEGPHCRDFFFVSQSVAPSVERFEVNIKTAASDHQPILLELHD